MSVNRNIKAFARLVWKAEGTYNSNEAVMYRTLYGGGTFSDFSRHPNTPVTKWGKTSTAAGAYQFLYSTWLGMQAKLSLSDFSPISQDKAFVEKLRERGIFDLIAAGRITEALERRGTYSEWSSLPGGRHQRKTLAEATNIFQQSGGTIL